MSPPLPEGTGPLRRSWRVLSLAPPGDLEDLFGACPNFFADVKFTHAEGLYWGFSDLHIVSRGDLGLAGHARLAQAAAVTIKAELGLYIIGGRWVQVCAA